VPDKPQFERGASDAATGAPMPQGEAQALNEAVADMPAPEQDASVPQAEAAPTTPTDDIAPAQPADYEPIYTPESDDEEFLTGPTGRPDEAQFVGATTRQAMSPRVRRAIPALQRAASEPGASAQLQELVAHLLREA